VKNTIAALVELQQVDDEVRVHTLQRDELAANLERLKTILTRMADELATKRDKLTEAQRFYDEKKIDLQGDADRLAKAKQKLAGVTRTKEYAAMQRELDALRKKFGEDEAELKRLAEAIEEYLSSINEQEAKLAELQAEVDREEAASAERLTELEQRIKAISARKKDIKVRLPRTMVSRYERVIKRREGKAVVPVDGGKCTGCQMRLPPQMYILVQRGESLQSCPSCHRYLFIEEYPDKNFEM
jgi:hypothetical protein